jgi:hypothetical protein
MQSGKVHPKGNLWRVSSNRGERFALSGLGEDGKELNGAFRVFISDAHERDFEVDENIPIEPSEET